MMARSGIEQEHFDEAGRGPIHKLTRLSDMMRRQRLRFVSFTTTTSANVVYFPDRVSQP